MEPVRRILSVLDRHVTGPAHIRVLGGAALILGYGRRRATEDVDLLLDDAEATFLAEERALGPALETTNAELEPEGLYLTHIWGPEQQYSGGLASTTFAGVKHPALVVFHSEEDQRQGAAQAVSRRSPPVFS